MPGVGHFVDELRRLGKYKTGKACLYIKRLADIDETVLRGMIEKSFRMMGDHVQQKQRAAAVTKTKTKTKK